MRHLSLIVTLGIIFSRLGRTPESELQYKKMWKEIKINNPVIYRKIRGPFRMCGWASLPGKLGREISLGGYRIAHSLVKFN
jgi:hypothetical protein